MKWTKTMLLIMALAGASTAWADDGAKMSDDPHGAGAVPATKTLPASASDTATANAFSVHGAAMRAAHQTARADDDAKSGNDTHAGAVPATKTLPASASDSARANAFNVHGTAMRAAHEAARAAAAQEAQRAATGSRPASPVRPNATASAHASAMGIANGFDRATAGASNAQPSTHRR